MNEQPQNNDTGQVQLEDTGQAQADNNVEKVNSIEADNTEKQEKDKRKRHITIAIILLIIIIILILLLLRQCSSDPTILNPDYPPQHDDPHASIIVGDGDDKLENEEGGGAVNLHFKDYLTIDLSDKQASLTFANPGRSTQDMVLWIMIQDQVIVQSGRLRPGYQVDTLDLFKNAERMLSEGVYDGKFVVYYYDPVTNERAMLNTEAPVTITVKP